MRNTLNWKTRNVCERIGTTDEAGYHCGWKKDTTGTESVSKLNWIELPGQKWQDVRGEFHDYKSSR